MQCYALLVDGAMEFFYIFAGFRLIVLMLRMILVCPFVLSVLSLFPSSYIFQLLRGVYTFKIAISSWWIDLFVII